MNFFKTSLSALIILFWLTCSMYICLGGLALTETIEDVRIIESRVKTEIVRKITLNEFTENDPLDIALDIINEVNGIDTIYSVKLLSFEDEVAIKDLSYVYWYCGFKGYSNLKFLTILPYTILLFLTVGAAGVIGGVAKIIVDHVRNITPIKDSQYIAFPIFGFFMGIMVIAISYIIPSVFIRGDTHLNLTSLVLISFFSGIFSDKFYNWIIVNIERFLKQKEPK